MLKPIVILALLGGPALADSKTLDLGLTLTAGNDARHYALKVAPDSCGRIESAMPSSSDDIGICARHEGTTDVRLEVDWTTHHDTTKLHNKSTVVVSRGQSFELDGGSAKLAVSVK